MQDEAAQMIDELVTTAAIKIPELIPENNSCDPWHTVANELSLSPDISMYYHVGNSNVRSSVPFVRNMLTGTIIEQESDLKHEARLQICCQLRSVLEMFNTAQYLVTGKAT